MKDIYTKLFNCMEAAMVSNETISGKQLIYIIVNFLCGSSLIILTGLRYAKKDVFICDIIGLILGLLFTLMMFYVISKYPNMEYTKILDKMFNPIGGRIIALFYLLYSFCLICFIEMNISGLITTMVMPKTPNWVIILTITLVAAYVMLNGIESLALNVEIVSPLVFFMIGFVYVVLSISSGNFNNLLPVFTESIGSIVKGTSTVFSFPYIDSFILIFILSLLKGKNRNSKYIKYSYLLAALFLIPRSEIVISALGVNEANRFVFPLFEAVRLIQIGNYIERLELILLFAWVISTYIRLTVCYYVILKCIEYIFNLTDYRKISLTLCIFVIPFSINTISSIEDIYYNNFISIPVIKLPMVLITILVFIKSLTKSNK